MYGVITYTYMTELMHLFTKIASHSASVCVCACVCVRLTVCLFLFEALDKLQRI